jgi:formylglycine-generating enzyme required for sulfatase activity
MIAKLKILLWVALLLTHFFSNANNIQVSNVSLSGQNITAGANNSANFNRVQFDLSWENSWRTSSAPNNWDAAWVFVKYSVNGGDWQHAYLNDTGHFAPAGTTIDPGLHYPDSTFHPLNNPCLGVFVYRSIDGSGTFSNPGIQLQWNYGANGINDNDNVEIGVFAIEMVYVPQDSFYLGDRSSFGTFYTAPNLNTPYFVTDEQTDIIVGSAAGNLTYSSGGDQMGPIPATYPKGYAAFYAMKYELTQGQYVDFLNTLTANQQVACTYNSPQSVSGTPALAPDTGFFSNRNGVHIQTPSNVNTPAVYGCNLRNNATFNEIDDGQWIACNWISRANLAAYLDWSALRPMTEMEFEKACRGSLLSVNGEFAWGTTTIVLTSGGLFNIRRPSEVCSNPNSNCTGSTYSGPIRVGSFADATSTRTQSGAGYYGMMDLSSNLWESTVSAGNAAGRAYYGQHGNGMLDAAGNADADLWQTAFGPSAGVRGGGYGNIPADFCISSRFTAVSTGSSRNFDSGGRGIRSAP